MATKQKAMRHATNAETLEHLMNWAKSGPIVQLFIMDALGKYADRVGQLTDEQAIEQIGDNGFISPIAWRNAAREIKTTLDDHYAGKRMVPVKDEDEDDDEEF
jgi:hypothetical protein